MELFYFQINCFDSEKEATFIVKQKPSVFRVLSNCCANMDWKVKWKVTVSARDLSIFLLIAEAPTFRVSSLNAVIALRLPYWKI